MPQEVGRKLSVDSLLISRIKRQRNEISISVELVNTRNGSLIWGTEYSQKLEDIIVIEEELANLIARELKIKLTGDEKLSLAKRYTENTEAYNLYWRGQYFWNKNTEESMKKGLECFEQAIEKDPNFALAYAGLAQCYVMLGLWGHNPPRSVYPKAKIAVKKALELDDTLAEVHSVMSMISLYLVWDWPAFEKHIKRAIELVPGYALTHKWNAEYLRIMGRFDEAIEEMKRALALDPLAILSHATLGDILRHSGREDEALEQLHKTLEINPNFGYTHFMIGWAHQDKGRYREAIAAYQKAIKLTGSPYPMAWLGTAYAKLGQRKNAMNMLRELEERSKQKFTPKNTIAIIYAAIGEIDKAFEFLEMAYQERNEGLLWNIKRLPDLNGFHLDPRYTALRKKMGLE